MDVYGYSAYQYNQSDELTKQMMAHQAFGVPSFPFSRGIPEPHLMPEPSGSPWNVQTVPWGSQSTPQLVQFTGQIGQSSMEPKYSPVLHCKRKNVDIEPPIPAKQLITEEKMAAHLSGLHISSDYTPHSLAHQENLMDLFDPQAPVSERLKGHKIILSEELKKLKDEPLLPPALIERLEKPCMSLVVWKPKENIIDKKLKEVEEKDEQKTDMMVEETPRRGVLVPELNGMDIEM